MSPTRRTWIILAALTAAEAVPLLLFIALDGTHFLRALGLFGGNAGSPLGWLLALTFGALYAGASASRSPFILSHLLTANVMKLFVLLLMAPVTGAFEELYFRKVLMNSLAAHGTGIALQIAASALIFGLVHGIWGLFGKSLRIAAGATVATTLLGLLMAVAFVAGGRSVLPCIAGHALVNAILEPWLILAAASRSWRGLQPAGR